MTIAASLDHVKKRVDDYLWRAKAKPMQRLRGVLCEEFSKFENVAIIGGLVRDFAHFGRRGFSSDVDLVIAVDPVELDDFAIKIGATRNRFGGFGLTTEAWKIDFWALENTWTHKQGHVELRELADITKSTFFTCDAIAYNIHERVVYAEKSYLDQFFKRTIDINLKPNPSIEGNLIRAIRRIENWDFRAGTRLREFIEENLDESVFERIKKTEASLYPEPVISKFGSSDALRKHCLDYRNRKPLHSQVLSQLPLPLLYDSH